MKNKKLIAGLAAGVMAMTCMSVTAFAEGEDDNSLNLETTAAVTEVAPEETTTADPNAEGTDAAEAENKTEVTTTVNANGSPKTGQSAYALFAVPVAVAAAAIIAKKQKKQ